ncbi:MAG: hypothetical protein OEL54_03530, partial [Flavobacteriaceae bacterium]|nr:hypothetical protein [Flavobacteriaceae bacterium]
MSIDLKHPILKTAYNTGYDMFVDNKAFNLNTSLMNGGVYFVSDNFLRASIENIFGNIFSQMDAGLAGVLKSTLTNFTGFVTFD